MVKRSRPRTVSNPSRYKRRGLRRMYNTAKKYKWQVGSQKTALPQRIRRIERMIETKEGTNRFPPNVALPHNNVYVLYSATQGADWNPFYRLNGTGDPMNTTLQMIGDKMTVKGLSLKFFLETALQRPKVYFRFMLLRGAKGETFNRDTIFKGDCNNKMLDQINVERFTVIAQKIFTVSASNTAASGVAAITGAPQESTNPPNGGVGTRIVKFWIPGRKFGKGGNVTYENQTQSQLKFYDYRMCILAYDWYGTPQDINNVGDINEGFSKLYFQDA